MATKLSANAFINDEKQVIELVVTKASIEEIQKAKAVADALGFKIVTKVSTSRSGTADKRNKQWFLDRLTDPKEAAEFEAICKARGKGKGFIAAKKWFTEKYPDAK